METNCPNCGHPTVHGQEVCGQCHRPLFSEVAANESASLRALASPVVNRYRDAYRVAAALVALGNSTKFGGVGVSVVIGLASINLGSFAPAGFVSGPNRLKIVRAGTAARTGAANFIAG